MPRPLVLLTLAALSAAPASQLAAQQAVAGSVTVHVTIHPPDSAAAATPAADIDMQLTGSTDGKQFAMEIVPNAGTSVTGGMTVKLIFGLGDDSMHVGVLLPPDMAATTGMPGMRIDATTEMLASSNPMLAGIMDSVDKNLGKPSYRSLRTTSTVAGISCAEWEVVSGATHSDTTRTCVVPTPPAMVALQEQLKKMPGMDKMLSQFPGFADMQGAAYGGKPMTALRTTSAKTGTVVEVVSVTSGAPDPSVFQLPANLQPMPVPGRPGGGRLP